MFITWGVCSGQNLVPNPSFEDTVYCPNGVDQMDACSNWSSFRNSPDYWNICSPIAGISPPATNWGFQYPLSGNAYAGFYSACYYCGVNHREFIGGQLTNILQTGTKYFVSFYINKSDGQSYLYVTNKLGVLFTTVAYSKLNPAPINNFAHVYTDSIIIDTLNWTKVSGSFIADSAYQFIVIGNFFDDAQTDSINLGTLNNASYYYIDNVCVSTDSLLCNSFVGINEVLDKEEFVLFPNPFSDKINITAKRNELIEMSLYDVTARKIFNQSFINFTSINTEQLAKGIYLYVVRNKNGVIKKGKIVKD
ncbi:MAG: T9SS type A sorting domain-containing protein [Bacteroidia bacterium]